MPMQESSLSLDLKIILALCLICTMSFVYRITRESFIALNYNWSIIHLPWSEEKERRTDYRPSSAPFRILNSVASIGARRILYLQSRRKNSTTSTHKNLHRQGYSMEASLHSPSYMSDTCKWFLIFSDLVERMMCKYRRANFWRDQWRKII